MVHSTEIRPNAAVYIGLFLLSTAILHLEMVQMRIFSFTLWHHLAYLVITIALLGFGAAGTMISILNRRISRYPRSWMIISTLIFAVTTIAAFTLAAHTRLDTFKLLTPAGIQFNQLILLFSYYAIFVIPFFCGGFTIAAAFTIHGKESHLLYFFNLLGSAAGVALFVLTIQSLGGERSVFLSSIIGALAAFVFALKPIQRKLLSIATVVIVLLIISNTLYPKILTPLPAGSKAFGMYMDTLPDFDLVYSKWNAISRIDVIDSDECMLPWFPEDESYAPHMAITIDGDATTWMWNFNAPSSKICGIRDNLYASAYHTKEKPEVLIIGLGGGNDLRTASHFCSRRIVGVELNPLIVEVLTEEFTDFVNNVAYDPNMEIYVGEGRSFVSRCSDKFDIIQMSGVDTWSGLSSGAYVLSENYLYTVEAFHDYMNHLRDDGILAVVRWYFKPPREMLRMLSVGSSVLRARGNEQPWNHIIVMVSGDFCATLFKKSPWTQQELAKYTWYAREQDEIEIRYSPGCNLSNPFSDYMKAIESDHGKKFESDYVYNLTPVHDDNPFFFDYYKWSNLPEQIFSSGTGGQIGANWPIAMAILSAMLIQALVLTLIFIFYPLTRFEQSGLKVPHAFRIISYFLCLGIGFIFIEIVLMQKLVLYLGHPIYSISVVLTSLLFFSGLGSLAASRLSWKKPHSLTYMLIGVVAGILILCALMPVIISHTLATELPVRIIITLVMLAIPAFLMGIPFPTGLVIVGKRAKPFIPWAWGANSGATVLGSIVAIIVAMTINFTGVILLGAASYLIAALVFMPFSKNPY